MTFPSLYLIADPVCYADSSALRSVVERRFLNGVHEAIEGGVQWIQYREKHATRGQMYAVANKLSQITRDTGV
ncbi:MAG: thiamine phosphate synthase, partial [Nitrospiria bacterium]